MSDLLGGLKPFEASYYDGVGGCWFDFEDLDAPKAIDRAERAWLERRAWVCAQLLITSQPFGRMQIGQC